jgi:Major intrinsic protein
MVKALFYILTACYVFSNNASAEAFAIPSETQRRFIGRRSFSDEVSGEIHCSMKRYSLRDGQSVSLSSTRGGNVSQKSFFQKPMVREMIAEFIGTFLIVQIGTGSVMSAIFTDSLVGLFQIASVWIIAVTVAICTTASISGAHLNPAVSLAFALVRPSEEFNWRKVLPYSMAQLAGAVTGSAVNLLLYASSIAAFENANSIVRASSSGLASARAFGEYFA